MSRYIIKIRNIHTKLLALQEELSNGKKISFENVQSCSQKYLKGYKQKSKNSNKRDLEKWLTLFENETKLTFPEELKAILNVSNGGIRILDSYNLLDAENIF